MGVVIGFGLRLREATIEMGYVGRKPRSMGSTGSKGLYRLNHLRPFWVSVVLAAVSLRAWVLSGTGRRTRWEMM